MRIGIIGVGRWGSKLMRVFTAELGEDNVKGYDLDNPWPKAGKVDAVAISTPMETHAELARRALQEDLDVLVEKPMTMSSKAAEELCMESERSGRVLMVDHTFLYNPACMTAINLARTNEIGKVLYIGSTRMNPGRSSPNASVLWDLGPHDASIILATTGAYPNLIASVISSFSDDVPDFVKAIYNLPGGVGIGMDLSWASARKIRRTMFLGTDGMIVYDDLDLDARVKVFKGLSPEFSGPSSEFATAPTFCPAIRDDEPLALMAQDFVDCCVNRKTPQSSGRFGLAVVRMLEDAGKAVR